ncbi:unnamed protein product [Closterium sp. NIES-53]
MSAPTGDVNPGFGLEIPLVRTVGDAAGRGTGSSGEMVRGAESIRSPRRTEWEDCSHEPAVEVRDVFMAPDPPVIGHPFELQLPAVARQMIAGGEVAVTIKFHGLPIHVEYTDICQQTACPVLPGSFTFQYWRNVPSLAFPGPYYARLMATDRNSTELFCIIVTLKVPASCCCCALLLLLLLLCAFSYVLLLLLLLTATAAPCCCCYLLLLLLPTATATATPLTVAAATATAPMANFLVLTFDAEVRAISFDVWLDDLQLYLQSEARDGISLFVHTEGTLPAPAATTVEDHSKWLMRDATARLTVRNHLPVAERAHFSQQKTAKALYDAVVTHYSYPANAALGRLMLPYLHPELADFHTVSDLFTHLHCPSVSSSPLQFSVMSRPPHVLHEFGQVAASSQVSASCKLAASCSCRVLSHQTLLWHHHLGHPSLPCLRSMHSRLLVSGLLLVS